MAIDQRSDPRAEAAQRTIGGSPITDWGRLQSAKVRRIVRPSTEVELQQLVREAARSGTAVATRGVAHSAGGQSFCDDAVVVDMTGLDRVLSLDEAGQTIRVQAGANWGTLSRVLEPKRLAVTTKQEFQLFTLGGSLAANVHGKTIDYGPLIESVESVRLLRSDGELITVSRTENAELFPAVIGGYGLLGIVTDVTLRLVAERPVEKAEVVLMDRDPLLKAYLDRVGQPPRQLPLCYGFFDAQCQRGYFVTYKYADLPADTPLESLRRDEPNPLAFDLLIWLERWLGPVRRRSFDLQWATSGKPEVTTRSRRLLLWDNPPRAFQGALLQKYFVPAPTFAEFARRAGMILGKYGDELPVFTNHFRFVPGNEEALLPFAPQDSICLIPCYLARKGSAAWVAALERATGELVDAALELGGRQYLAFDIIASREQFHRAYPRAGEFFALKRQHDPDALFRNRLFEKYS
ncbi:MAG TPA: FAD-binding oxidoreductase [Isosphaeraceae bacterium]|nr:FAD-binding oxidoreductase [Isosphaeraceae bacterium]